MTIVDLPAKMQASILPNIQHKTNKFNKVYKNPQPRVTLEVDERFKNYAKQISPPCDGAQGDPLKWQLPGWRIEQRFSKQTLIGNWCEERNNFEHSDQTINSTSRIDYNPDDIKSVSPSTKERRFALRRNEGSTSKYNSHNYSNVTTPFLSWYDIDYRRTNMIDKPIRNWNQHALRWEMKRNLANDETYRKQYSKPTQLGILQQKQKRWTEDKNLLNGSMAWKPSTTYGDFKEFSAGDFPLRYAQAPKHLSSKMNQISRTNKHLPLRGKQLLCPPEHSVV